jgi:eukaryotic-like serine/threonine-protein kinase
VSELPDFEPYVTLRRLERGSSYELFLARHATLQRQVWIKALRPEVPLSSSVARRLEREGEILARLQHESVIGILDCVRRTPRLWLVLEAVDGWNLAEVLGALQRTGAAASEVAGPVALTLSVARALLHAHEAGVVHAGVQPEHILISRHGSVKLSGFSLARLVEGPDQDPVDTEPGLSEAGYLSPEQVAGERADERSDLFSLAVVLYELLTGRHPFGGTNERRSHERGAHERATAHEIRHSAASALREFNADVSPELERIVQRCLEKAPERRFDAMGQLVRALEHVLGNDSRSDLDSLVARMLARSGLAVAGAAPVQRKRADQLERRAARRGLRRALLSLLTASLLLLVGGALLSSWLEAQHPRAAPAPQHWTSATGAELLVVADPWAYVFVDGEQLETTPFATPLRLAPGEHFVRLEHPHAPAEHRRIALTAGQRVVLEVTMQVERNARDAGLEDAPDAAAP